MINKTLDQVDKLMAEYKHYPEKFLREILTMDPTEQQIGVIRAFAGRNAHLSIKSCHGAGKSGLVAGLLIHSLFFFGEVKIGVSAPTGKQVRDIIFAEVRLWLAKAPPWWANQIKVTRDSIRWIDNKGNPGNREALCRTSRPENPEALAGLHSKNMLLLIDEASGMAEAVFPTIEGALSTEGAKIILISNPTRTDGYFYKTHTDNEDGLWKTFTFSAYDSPLVEPSWIEYMAKKYGKDSDVFRVRVLGEFPRNSENIYMIRHFVESAYYRDVKDDTSRRIAGLDVARFGSDATDIVIRQGNVIKYMEEWRSKDTMWTASHVEQLYLENKFDVIYVDVIGVGSGVVDRLKQLGVPVVAVNVAEGSSSKKEYFRLRDEIWYRTKLFFEEQTCGVDQELVKKEDFEELTDELCMVTYDFSKVNGSLKIEAKSDMKKRGVASPNRADALTYTFVNEITGVEGIISPSSDKAQTVDMAQNVSTMG